MFLVEFLGPNIALNKPATQYPGVYCYNYGNSCYNASLAVDGKEDNDGHLQGHCTHTTYQYNNRASWEVDFEGFHHITGIQVFNRKSSIFCRQAVFCLLINTFIPLYISSWNKI